MLLKQIKNEIQEKKEKKEKNKHKVIIYDYDMKENLIELIVEICVQNQEIYWINSQNELKKELQFMKMAQNIKIQLDHMKISSGKWQIIVGQKFGTFITHESFYFLHFSFDGIFYTLFVTG